MREHILRGMRARLMLLGVASVAAVLTIGVSSAAAAITTSNITAPADGSLLFQNHDMSPNQMFTVTGTTDGTAGDFVDIACYEGGQATAASYDGPGGTGIAVGSDGSFSIAVPQFDFASWSCQLLAVPHGTRPSAGSSFTGPRVGFSDFTTDTISGGPNSGDTDDFDFDDALLTGNSFNDSIDSCGPGTYPFDGSAAMNAGNYLLFCAGSFYNSANTFDSTTGADLTRSELQVDGQNAYGSDSAENLFSGSDGLSGFPAMTVTVDGFAPSTGDAQITETEPLVKCTPNDVYDPGSSDCTSFTSTGVSDTRVTSFTNGGRVQKVTDTYSSTDDAEHTLDLQYETDLANPNAGWELPGQSSFAEHSTGDTGPAPAAAPGTVYVIHDAAQAPSLTNPVAAMTFFSPYSSVRFDDTLWSAFGNPDGSTGEESAVFDYQRAVPAGGSTTITWNYGTGTSLAEVQRYAAAAEDSAQPPSIAISSPAGGATESTSPITVSGTADAGSGVKSVSVNGVGATFSGNTWRATVPLSAGQNTLSAIVTSKGGETAKVSEVVTYRLSPRASISAPATGGTYALDQSVATSFTCSEGAGGPGLASCDDANGTNTSGGGTGHLNTAALGQHTYAVTAKSKDGKSATVSIAYTVVAAKISISTARAQYAHGKTKLRLACAGPAGGTCTGTVTLTSRVKRTVVRNVHGHRRRITIFKTVALAHAHYSLRAGTNKLVVLRLTHPAKVLLAHARKHTVRVHVSASVHGGKTAARRIALAPAPRHRRHG